MTSLRKGSIAQVLGIFQRTLQLFHIFSFFKESEKNRSLSFKLKDTIGVAWITVSYALLSVHVRVGSAVGL